VDGSAHGGVKKGNSLGFLGPAFWVVILLGVMILIHELGHFWAALAVGVKVETFSLGFGPRLFGFRRGDTDFRVSAIPFGGYVRMLGDQPGDENALDPRSFQAKARWQRAIVIVAGPLMNIILAVSLVTGLYMAKYPKELDTVITGLVPDSPAAHAGLKEGDRIIQFEDDKRPTWDYIVSQELVSAGRPLHLMVERAGKPLAISVTPKLDEKEGVGQMGLIAEPNTEIGEIKAGGPAQAAGLKRGDLFLTANGVKVFSAMTVRQAVIHSGGKPVQFQILHDGKPVDISVTPRANTTDPAMPFQIGVVFQIPIQWTKLGFADAFAHSIEMNERNATTMFQVLAGVLERRVSPKSFSGPIGIAQMSSEAASQGPWMYLSLMAFVSLQLAIFNLLPIPILDGGTLLLLLIEMLMQREVSLRVKETVFKLGFVFLMMLVVFVIYNDLTKVLTRS
jgi:regulator of sigma E protease